MKQSDISVVSTNVSITENKSKVGATIIQSGQNSMVSTNYSPISNMQQSSISRTPYFKLYVLRADLSLKKQLFSKANPYCMVKYSNKVMKT